MLDEITEFIHCLYTQLTISPVVSICALGGTGPLWFERNSISHLLEKRLNQIVIELEGEVKTRIETGLADRAAEREYTLEAKKDYLNILRRLNYSWLLPAVYLQFE
ncbi:hypothetical protein A9Q83_04330 [Alphaproteobacteria bacterium 46_93_T64]|nr:hypothetical protein A9Q83_04330 [Alphaproteobacteria bacterium 46_93_T64]